jgi:multicomponent Na+:H+ antiporter subunit E
VGGGLVMGGRVLARWRRSLWAVLALTGIWVVMNEQLTWLVVGSGAVIAVVTLALTDRLLGIDHTTTVFLHPLAWVRYLLLLVREMAVAAWFMAVTIVRGRATVTQFELVSELDDELLLFLLANSIILTPGSVATDRRGGTITVVTCDDDVDRAVAGCRRLERAVARIGAARVHRGAA